MHRITAGAFDKVVDTGYHQQFVTVFLQMQQTVVGINYLL